LAAAPGGRSGLNYATLVDLSATPSVRKGTGALLPWPITTLSHPDLAIGLKQWSPIKKRQFEIKRN